MSLCLLINDCLISTLRLGQKGKGRITVLTVATIFIDAILYQNYIICTQWKVLRAQFDSLSTDGNLLSKRLGEKKQKTKKPPQPQDCYVRIKMQQAVKWHI